MVLDYLRKEFQNNRDFSDKLLTFNAAMLSILTQTSKVRGLHILDTRFMAKTSQKYVQKLHKSRIKGQKVITL